MFAKPEKIYLTEIMFNNFDKKYKEFIQLMDSFLYSNVICCQQKGLSQEAMNLIHSYIAEICQSIHFSVKLATFRYLTMK